jgi:ABC-type ATPase with predicted acetyltransferase domain
MSNQEQAHPVPNVGDSVWVWFCNNCGAAEGATMQAGCCRHCGVSDGGTRLLLRVEVKALPKGEK